MKQVSTSFRMVPKICTRPTSRRARASAIATPSSPRSLATAVLSRAPLYLTYIIPKLFTDIRYSSGGAIAGSVSQHIGRRLTIILFVFFSGAFIPLWILPSSFSGLAAGAFFVQFGVQGAWGVIPIQLAEMSPPGFRATFPGVAYQLGNVRRVLYSFLFLFFFGPG